ncbi:MAG: STAS domain-containing protein [Spirochaetales bacterium]|jgi:anti-sigma B factor antagonist|nr:STAS domain-containing protein [Spirochaetales bacterium]
MEIQFFEDADGKSLVVKVSGDCDLYNAHHLFSDVTGRLSGGVYSVVYVDLSGSPYMDSSGVGALIRILQYTKSRSINLKFRGIEGTVRKVMRLSNILSIITEDRQ